MTDAGFHAIDWNVVPTFSSPSPKREGDVTQQDNQ